MKIVDVVFPASCLLCAARGGAVCGSCAAGLGRAPELPLPPGLARLTLAFSYEGAMRRLIGGLKYGNRRAVCRFLASHMASALPDSDFDCITWMPSSRAGRVARGYEPARLLARELSSLLGLPSRSLLRRLDDSPQTSRSRVDRLAGPRLRALRSVADERILLVDDVCTTGGSLARAASVLSGAGAAHVEAVAAAGTPCRVRLG